MSEPPIFHCKGCDKDFSADAVKHLVTTHGVMTAQCPRGHTVWPVDEARGREATHGDNAPIDLINHPPHYISPSGLESIQVIEAFSLGFHLGNAIKYILRAGNKGSKVEDLKKARWYIDRQIANWDA